MSAIGRQIPSAPRKHRLHPSGEKNTQKQGTQNVGARHSFIQAQGQGLRQS